MKRSAIQRNTPLSARKPAQRDMHKESRFRSATYLAFVRSLPCCVCGGKADSAHHLTGLWNLSGVALKAPDQYSIPVCDGPAGCHRRIHADPNLQRLQPGLIVDTINRGLDHFTTEPLVGALCDALEFIAEREQQ